MGIAAVSRHPFGARRHTSDHGTRRPLRSSVTATVADVGVPGAASSQFTNLYIGYALCELQGLFGLLIALILLFT